jgi:hypothetical protein
MFTKQQNSMICEQIQQFISHGGIDQITEVDSDWASAWRKVKMKRSHFFRGPTIEESKAIHIVKRIIQSVVGEGHSITDRQCLEICKSYSVI